MKLFESIPRNCLWWVGLILSAACLLMYWIGYSRHVVDTFGLFR